MTSQAVYADDKVDGCFGNKELEEELERQHWATRLHKQGVWKCCLMVE